MSVTKIVKYPRRIVRQKVRGVRVAITDGAPALALAVEKGDLDIMQQKEKSHVSLGRERRES